MNLDKLNEVQRQAVLCTDAPMLVIAGAGSGKTRVLTYKIAYLLTQGYQPWQILALTFTNKAAREMQSRIAELVEGGQASQLWMGTFHSIFCRILRYEAERIGFRPDFTIYDASDSKALVTALIKEMGLDEKLYKASHVCSQISRAKNALVWPSQYAADPQLRQSDNAARMPMIHAVYARYHERCRMANAMDFDDILLYTWHLLESHPDVAERYAERFRYVLVDEYQDTNYAQHKIVWQLAHTHRQVCVVGDDAQSIYSFRGANIDNILQFRQQYAGARLFKLEQNYRSTQTIVNAANSLIHHNRNQIHKDVFSRNSAGDPVLVLHAYSDADEANQLVQRIRQLALKENIAYMDMAILYRTNAQSRSIEEALRRDSIPYRIFGGLSFYQRKEIKDVTAYFRLAVNPHDEVSLKRVINYPARGIGQTTLDKVFAFALQHSLTPWQVICQPEQLGVNRGTQAKLSAFAQMITQFNAEAGQTDAYHMALRILDESGIRREVFTGQSPEDISRQENVQELLDGISAFVEESKELDQGTLLTHYLQKISLLSDQDEDEQNDDNRVTLMTVHSAKGLEFDAVMVSGMEENLFPSQMSLENPRQIEEERRLFYVAMTRARHHLVLSHARSRFRYGKTEFCAPSRFLREIDPRFVQLHGAAGEMRRPLHSPEPQRYFIEKPSQEKTRLEQTRQQSAPRILRPLRAAATTRLQSPASSFAGKLESGTRIAHERFGQGTVLSVEGSGLDAKARVSFDNAGEKQLLLRFAKFTVIG